MTGATGFTGRRVLARLRDRGHEVRALVRAPAARLAEPGVVPVVGDVSDGRALAALLAGCAGFVGVAPLAAGGGGPLAAALDASPVRRAVHFSTASVHSRLATPVKAPWLRAEERVRASRPSWTLLRPTMIYGDAGDRNLSRLVRFVARAPLIPLPGGGRALVQPVHVDDVAQAAARALESEAAIGRAYELPGGTADPLRAVVEWVRAAVGSRAPVVTLPIRPLAVAIGLWSRLGLPPRLRPDQVLRLAEDRHFSAEAAERDLGFAPRGWRAGLADEVRLLREAGWIR